MGTRTRTITRSAAMQPRAPAVRLTLAGAPSSGQRQALDGAWWPATTNLADEVPDLLAELERRGVRVTRMTFNQALWDPAPRRMTVGGRVVRLGSSTTMDRHLVALSSGSAARRLQLLVVPPDTADDVAREAMSRAAEGEEARPAAVLELARERVGPVAGLRVPVPRPAGGAADEGGHGGAASH